MPTFTREYTAEYAAKVTPAMLALAKDNEGHRKVQQYLATSGATEVDGVYQIDSIPAKEQVGIMFDLFVWRQYQKFKVEEDVEQARADAIAEIDDDFEQGGPA